MSVAPHPGPRRSPARAALALAIVVAIFSVAAGAASANPRGGHDTARHAHSADAGVALQWYDITDNTVKAAAFPEPVTQSRVWALSWLAAARAAGHASDPGYRVAAFAQALHDTLVAQVPSQQSSLDADLASTLAGVPDGSAKSAGIAAGKQQASALLAARSGDGLDTASVDSPFTPPPPAPGVWQPTPPTYGATIRAGQGKAKSFLLARNDQFDPGPPPSLSSRTYRDALAEVHAYGSETSAVRTPAQTDTAKFWEPAANIQYVQVVRGALADTNAPLQSAVRFVAAFHVVTTDAQIAIYNAKYKYLFWRPVTAIRTGSIDPDPNWTPLFATPLHPEYPSGHGGYAGASEGVLTAFLGRRAPGPISATSPSDPGSTHSYRDWSSITQEVIDARVWEGIHFRTSDDTGARLGEQVAGYELPRLRSLGL
ncbi:MAG TPA: vanadium-dependent haloperoxidase [Solirubrobacteraceae bacterium]|nr:vanadium-dependent haloperoxidase [Solirubrobacteraceae bacterium]